MRKLPIVIILILLLLSGLGHLVRFILNWPMIIGSITLAPWTGAIAFIISTLLVFWSFYALYFTEDEKT